jgi:hypothetical protein
VCVCVVVVGGGVLMLWVQAACLLRPTVSQRPWRPANGGETCHGKHSSVFWGAQLFVVVVAAGMLVDPSPHMFHPLLFTYSHGVCCALCCAVPCRTMLCGCAGVCVHSVRCCSLRMRPYWVPHV